MTQPKKSDEPQFTDAASHGEWLVAMLCQNLEQLLTHNGKTVAELLAEIADKRGKPDDKGPPHLP